MGEATSSPLRPNTLVDALPLVPGAIRTPDGRVQIVGLDEEHSSLLINSVNVNDPATGSFGLSVPVDSVDILKVMQSPTWPNMATLLPELEESLFAART